MQTFLSTFTWDIIVFSMVSLWHSFFLLCMGFAGGMYVLYKMNTWEALNAAEDVPAYNGWRAMLFGVILGSVDYMAGNVTKNLTDKVMLSLGFATHEYDSMASAITTTTITNPTGVTSSFTQTAETAEVDYDFAKLLKLQDKWFNFFALQRTT